jgi:hypothetical protein
MVFDLALSVNNQMNLRGELRREPHSVLSHVDKKENISQEAQITTQEMSRRAGAGAT